MQVLNDLNLEGLEKYNLNYAMLLSDYQTADGSTRLQSTDWSSSLKIHII